MPYACYTFVVDEIISLQFKYVCSLLSVFSVHLYFSLFAIYCECRGQHILCISIHIRIVQVCMQICTGVGTRMLISVQAYIHRMQLYAI